ncbi:MAG: ParA family protein [Prochloraceae cyanobacterium]|nr:ParA family protein [Prochloraceae cyanobacterium]
MGSVISTVNMKGGVGKTTLTVNLATCLAKYHNKKVLVIDLDSQINATLSLMMIPAFAKVRKKRHTLGYLVDKAIEPNTRKKFSIEDLIIYSVCDIEGLDLLPGDIELYDEYVVSQLLHQKAIAEQESNFEQVWDNFEKILVKEILDPIVDEYDLVIIDCPPNYNLLTRSAIIASDFYLLPARPEPLSVVGIQLLQKRIEKLKQKDRISAAIDIQMLGIVFVLSGGTLLGRYYRRIMKRVQEDFGNEGLFQTAIPMDVNVAKAVDMFKPAVLVTPNSSGSKAFIKLTAEFLEKFQTKAIAS